MIKTIKISESPLIIKHTLSGTISEEQAQNGVDKAIELIEKNIALNKKIRILIDVRKYSFETLEARRVWSLQFKMNKNIQKRTELVAIVGPTSEEFRTEKKWMETTKLMFFTTENEAKKWLTTD